MIHTQEWWPDTCDCIVTQEWDDANPAVVTATGFRRKCDAHSVLEDLSAHPVVLENNQRKNFVRQQLVEGGYNLDATFTQTDGSTYVDFKQGFTLNWSWTGSGYNRVLNIWFTGVTLTTNQRNKAQAWCDTRFGVGKVLIV